MSNLSFALALALAACAPKAPPAPPTPPAPPEPADASHGAPEEHAEAHWAYAGDAGPDAWGDLKAEYAACGEGTAQSPIDLPVWGEAVTPEDALDVHLQPSPLQILNNGHAVQIEPATQSWTMVGDHRYDLAQVHFHSPSEHTVEGRSFPLEAHMVHLDADGNIAVVGILFEEGDANPTLASIWEHLPDEVTEEAEPVEGVEVDLSPLVDAGGTYAYAGSLTTPPCTEGLRWFVLSKPQSVSADQVQAYHDLMGRDTNRPVQPLNGRVVSEYAR